MRSQAIRLIKTTALPLAVAGVAIDPVAYNRKFRVFATVGFNIAVVLANGEVGVVTATNADAQVADHVEFLVQVDPNFTLSVVPASGEPAGEVFITEYTET